MIGVRGYLGGVIEETSRMSKTDGSRSVGRNTVVIRLRIAELSRVERGELRARKWRMYFRLEEVSADWI